MTPELIMLSITAASIGFFHTLLGPDHYLPFIMMSRAGKWSLIKTTWITVLSGLGHVAGSVILGLTGIALGLFVTKLEAFEGIRGNLAAWLLIAFGLIYFIWGIRNAYKRKSHRHLHFHANDHGHEHPHTHTEQHAHVHEQPDQKSMKPWILFVIFVLGPCEPLIPILMYPAAKQSILGLGMVTLVFGSVTIFTMLGVVLVSSLGLKRVSFGRLERYSHALAGAAIFLCGVGMAFLGL